MTSETMKILKLDARLAKRFLQEGKLTKEELEKHLKSLPDLTNASLKVEVEEPIRIGDDPEETVAKTEKQPHMREDEEE